MICHDLAEVFLKKKNPKKPTAITLDINEDGKTKYGPARFWRDNVVGLVDI